MSVPEVPVELAEHDEPLDVDVPWQRLSGRMIAVDLARTLISIAPSLVAFVLLDVPLTWGTGGPLLGLGLVGVVGAGADALRWLTTRYRVTDDYLERATGLFFRRYRTLRLDRIRSVDTDARLRHRLAGLRVVLVGAGQQTAASESALSLDAVTREGAFDLRRTLLRERDAAAPTDDGAVHPPEPEAEVRVIARFRGWWVVYNVLGVWAYLMAAGLVWGGGWFLAALGVDVFGWSAEAVGWPALDWFGRAAWVVGVLTVIGVIGLAINYLTTYWGFELSRVPTGETTQLRTRHGLFRTRDVSRDDRRLRGVMISEPLLWRWMRMADTEVITTGLAIYSMSQPSVILPRGPRSVARRAATAVLDHDPDPISAVLARPPRRALRRRLVWATVATSVIVMAVSYAVWWSPLPGWTVWLAAGSWPVALGAAVLAYRALGYGVVGAYAVVRSGLVSRRTAALQRSAVSTVVVRESLLQRRLGLRSVTLATAAGWGGYTAADLSADASLRFATEAASGLLEPFVADSR